MLNSSLLHAASAVVLTTAVLFAQKGMPNQDRQITEAPDYMLRALELERGTMQTIDVPVDGVPSFEVKAFLSGAERRLKLRAYDMRSAGYKLMVQDENGTHEVAGGPVTTYRGFVIGDPDSLVAASLQNDQLEAVIILGDSTTWGIHPTHRIDKSMPRSAHLIYEAANLLEKDATCGVTAIAQAAPAITPEAASPEASSPTKVAEIALDADWTYWQSNGSSVSNTEADMMNVLNVVDAIYQRDVGIQYRVSVMFVRTVQVYIQTTPSQLLSEFANRWSTTHRTLPRDVAHLFFDKGIRGGVIGIARLGVICNRFSAYGISATRFSFSLARRAALTAHELGHNWSAPHCPNSSSDCRIMCAGLGGCSGDVSRFGTASRNTIIAHKDTRACLSDPAPMAPLIGSITPQSSLAFPPEEITVRGTDLDTVTRIDIDNVTITDFTIESADTIRFTPAEPLPINFLNQLTVTNPIGTSNFLFMTVFGNHPSILVVDAMVSGSAPIELGTHTDREWMVFLFASVSNVPSAFPGIVDLAIGDNFTRLISLRSAIAGTNGSHDFSIDVPPTLPLPFDIHWQLITLSGPSSALPLEVSNSVMTTIF